QRTDVDLPQATSDGDGVRVELRGFLEQRHRVGPESPVLEAAGCGIKSGGLEPAAIIDCRRAERERRTRRSVAGLAEELGQFRSQVRRLGDRAGGRAPARVLALLAGLRLRTRLVFRAGDRADLAEASDQDEGTEGQSRPWQYADHGVLSRSP